MLSFLRFPRFGFGHLITPIFLFSLLMLTLSMIFTTLLLTGATADPLRKFYLLELRYKQGGSLSKVAELAGSLGPQDGKQFGSVRVGYRGSCVLSGDKDSDDKDWACLPIDGSKSRSFSGDPLQLVDIAELYSKHISFSLPLWASLTLLAVSWLATAISCVPVIPIPKVTHKVAAAAAGLAVLALCGGMTLQHVTGGAVATLVRKMGMEAVNAKLGTTNQAIGWSAFALAMLAATGTGAVVVVETLAEKAREAAERKAEELVGVSAASSLRGGTPPASSGAGAGGVRGQAQSLATKVMREGLKRAQQKQTV